MVTTDRLLVRLVSVCKLVSWIFVKIIQLLYKKLSVCLKLRKVSYIKFWFHRSDSAVVYIVYFKIF